MSAEPFIAYEPPHGGQNLRIRRIAEVWERTARFLTTCTDADLTAPAWPKLTLYEPAPSDPSEWFVPTLAAVQETFGPGRRRAWTAGACEDCCHEASCTVALAGESSEGSSKCDFRMAHVTSPKYIDSIRSQWACGK